MAVNNGLIENVRPNIKLGYKPENSFNPDELIGIFYTLHNSPEVIVYTLLGWSKEYV